MHVTIITLVAAACLGLVKAKTVDAEIHDLINLGQVEGKNYYYDSTTVRDWSESGNYCIESGMELATIDTSYEAEFLKYRYSMGGFYGYFWTGALDAQIPTQYNNNSTGTMLTNATGLPSSINGNLESQTCVMYLSLSTPSLAVFPCARFSYVLCQKKAN